MVGSSLRPCNVTNILDSCVLGSTDSNCAEISGATCQSLTDPCSGPALLTPDCTEPNICCQPGPKDTTCRGQGGLCFFPGSPCAGEFIQSTDCKTCCKEPTCASVDGICVAPGGPTCPGGEPFPASDCPGLNMVCCPAAETCGNLGGMCISTADSCNGNPFQASDCGVDENCCVAESCSSLGGMCQAEDATCDGGQVSTTPDCANSCCTYQPCESQEGICLSTGSACGGEVVPSNDCSEECCG